MEILIGRNPVLESLRAGRRKARRLLLTEGVREEGIVADLVVAARGARIDIERVPKSELDRLAQDDVSHRWPCCSCSSFGRVS